MLAGRLGGRGQVVAVGCTGSATRPVAAYAAWLEAAGATEGAVFLGVNRQGRLRRRLSTDTVAEIIQRRAAAAEPDAALFSGHSMRAGFATSAAMAGVKERLIMRQTRHRSAAHRYICDGQLFARNLAQEVEL